MVADRIVSWTEVTTTMSIDDVDKLWEVVSVLNEPAPGESR